MNKLKKFLFLFILGFFVFYPKDTYADGLVNVPSSHGTMGYYINGGYGNNDNWSGTFPVELLTSVTNYSKYLYGISTGVPDLSNDYSGTYYNNSVRVILQLHRMGNQGVMDWNQNVNKQLLCMSNNQQPKYGTCGVKSANNQYITFECQCSYDHNDYPISADVTIGKTSNFTYGTDPYIGRTFTSLDSSLYIQALQYEATSSNTGGGSSTDYTQELEDINSNIEDVNDNLNDVNQNLEDIHSDIISDTVPSSSDFGDFIDDITDIVANGNPLGQLLTLPLTFVTSMVDYLGRGESLGCYPVLLMDFSSITNKSSDKIYLPCFDGSLYFNQVVLTPLTLWDVIDYFFCFYMFYNIVMLFIHVYSDISTLSIGVSSNAANTGTPSTSPYGRKR